SSSPVTSLVRNTVTSTSPCGSCFSRAVESVALILGRAPPGRRVYVYINIARRLHEDKHAAPGQGGSWQPNFKTKSKMLPDWQPVRYSPRRNQEERDG